MQAITFTENINDAALREAIEAVEENNRMNGSEWSNWDNAAHVVDVYEIEGLCEEVMEVLNRAISSNGASLKVDLPAVELAFKGQNFAGGFWDRA